MNTQLIMRTLGKFLAILSVPSLLCAVWALGSDRYHQASLFVLLVTCLVVLSAVLLIAIPKNTSQAAGLKETVWFLMSAWGCLSLLGAIPFVLVTDGELTLALFESVSCATTTGASMIDYATPLSPSLVAWRGVLHFMGATLSISGTIVLLAQSAANGDFGGQKIQAKSVGLTLKLSTFSRLFAVVAAVIAIFALIPFVELTMSGFALREAFSLSVGAATSGQVLPYEFGAKIASSWSGFLLALILLVASMDMTVFLSLPRDYLKSFRDSEMLWMFGVIVLLLGILFFIQSNIDPLLAFSEAASIVSTSGLMLPDEKLASIGVPVLIFFGFVGGSAISATGGMKLFRIRLLMARTGYEFSRLAQPNAIMKFQMSKVQNPVISMMTVWVYFLGFAVVAAALASYLSILGLDFDDALMVSTGAVTNSAALFRTELLGEFQNAFTHVILTISMVFGRLELLLLLSLVFRA